MSGQGATPDTREPITSGARSNIVDIVKGIAIILVAYGHTAQGIDAIADGGPVQELFSLTPLSTASICRRFSLSLACL